jgi:hypothetical protein
MHQRDYILRIIEQVGAALAALRRRILSRGGAAGTSEQLESVASQAGFDVALLRGFDVATLRLLVSPLGEVDPTRCWLMAEVLYLDGLEETLSGRDGGDSFLKARALYDLIRPTGGMLAGMAEADERIAEIDRYLRGPPDLPEPRGRLRSRRLRARVR